MTHTKWGAIETLSTGESESSGIIACIGLTSDLALEQRACHAPAPPALPIRAGSLWFERTPPIAESARTAVHRAGAVAGRILTLSKLRVVLRPRLRRDPAGIGLADSHPGMGVFGATERCRGATAMSVVG
jgi:hypothetical protein